MSAESSNPSSLPGRNRPQLSDLSRETTEDDLWNLDEEPTPTLPLKPKLGPAAAVSSKEPAGGHEPAEPAGEPQAPAVPAETPPMPRGRHSAVKPLIPRTLPDEIGDLDEDDSKPGTPSPKEEIAPLTTAIDHHPADEEAEAPAAPAVATPPDKTRAKGKGRKSKAKAKDKTPAAPEEEIPAAVAEPEPEPVIAEPEPVVPEAELQPEPEIQPPAEPEAEPEPEPGPEAGPETEPEDSYGDYADEEPDEPQALRENRPRAATPAAKGPLPIARMNRREVIWVASFGVVVMIAAVWVLSHFFTQLSFTRDSDSKPKYPLKGELAWVASATTFWREPVREGEDRDVARREVVLIPVLELSLDPSHSGGGAMRVIFRNSDGEPLGDPITRSFGAGRFEASGSSTMTFAATNGFTQDGDFQAYRTGRGKLWTADVLEGPPGDSQASDFKKISSIPLLPDRR